MSRRPIALMVAALAAAAAFSASACGAEPQSPAAAARGETVAPTTAAAARLAVTDAPAPSGVDPNDVAFTLDDRRPCTAPCWKQDVVYGRATNAFARRAGRRALRLDLYRAPQTPRRGAPVVILVHGGGFVEGDKSSMRRSAELLASRGFLVASIQYRLVPAGRPGSRRGIAADRDLGRGAAQAEDDARRAMRWIRRHRTSLGASGEQRRYAVGGYSAGAITALRVAVRGGDRSTPRSERWRVGGAFAIAGTECGPWAPQLACELAYDRRDAPLLLFNGTDDDTVPVLWGRSTCAAAVVTGGGCTAYFYEGMSHFWDAGTVYGGTAGLTEQQPAVIPTVAAWLRARLT